MNEPTIYIRLSVAQRRMAAPVIQSMGLRGAYDFELTALQLREFTAAVYRLPKIGGKAFRTWDALTSQLANKRRALDAQIALRHG